MSCARPFAALAAALALGACSKIAYVNDPAVTGWSPTVVLMHRGAGNLCGDAPLPCYPNTLPAVRRAFETLDGSEVDIEISANQTLWLGHDNEVLDCDGVTHIGCFQNLQDGQIDAVAYCDGSARCTPDATNAATCIQHYVRAEDVFSAIHGWTVDGTFPASKLVSLDIKGQYCGGGLGAPDAQRIADELDRLVRQYALDDRVLTETQQLPFQDRIKQNQTPLYSFWIGLSDIDAALGLADTEGAVGISYGYSRSDAEPVNASVVSGIHGSGFRIMLWTIDRACDILAAWAAAPDAIQTDEPTFHACLIGDPACAAPACTP